MKEVFCLRNFVLLFIISFSLGCYYFDATVHHAKIYFKAKDYQKNIDSLNLSRAERDRLNLTIRVLHFVEHKLGLETKGNYKSFVRLEQDYVTYLVTVAKKWKLELVSWSYPIVGTLPYRGFSSLEKATKEAATFDLNLYDVDIRGVSAYSTLGWLKDPVLSSMIGYREEEYIELLIHELFHANLFYKSEGELNEQLATFMGLWGTQLFYADLQDSNSSDQEQEIIKTLEGRVSFSKYLKQEKIAIQEWYNKLTAAQMTDDTRRLFFEGVVNKCKK